MSVRSLNGLSGSTVNINTLSGGTAISILNQNINLDINKASLASTTASSDQYILEDANGNTKKILYSTLIGSSGSGLTAGEALTITSNVLDVSISKQSAITSSADTDVYLLEDANGNIKKITRANLLAGTISAEWNLVGTTLSTLNSSSNVVIGGTSMSGSEKLRIIGDSVYDGKITITGSNVLEATALTGAYNFNIQNTNVSNNGTLNLMGVNNGGATNLLTIRNDVSTPKLTFPSGFWVNNFGTNITNTELLYLSGVSSNIQSQFNTITTNVSNNSSLISTNSGNITTLQNSVSSLQTQQSTNTAAIANNSSDISSNSGSINSNALNISTLQSDVSSNTSSISSNTTSVNNIKTKYDFTGSVSNGKLLIGSGSNYSVGELLSSDNSITITKSAGGIDIIAPSSSSLSAGVAIAINSSNIDLDINKPNSFTSPVSADLLVMYDTTNSLTKKITFSDFNSGLQAQITTNSGLISSNSASITTLTNQQTTNTNNISSNSTAITNLTSTVNTNSTNISNNSSSISTNSTNISSNSTEINNVKSRIAYSSTITDGQLLIGNTSSGNFSASTLASSGGTITITNSGGGINLETSGSSLSAGVAIAINTNNIDLDINKPNVFTSPVSADLLVMYDTTNSLTKKITFQNFNAGLQSQITSLTSSVNSNSSDITSLNSSVSTNTSNIALNTAAIANIASTASSSNFGTTASSAITVGNNSQTLAINSASMTAISAGKHFFRSNLSTGLSFEVQGYNSGGPAYHSVLQVHNVSSGFPYLSFLLGSGFQTSQFASKSIVIDANGKLDVGNLSQTLTAGEGIALNSNAIDIDISKQVAIASPANDDVFLVERNTGVINKITYGNLGIGVVAGNAIAVSGTTVNVEISKPSSITSPASGDLFLLEQAVDGVLKNISYSDLSSGLTVGGGIGISVDSTPDVNIDFSTVATATQMFSNNQFIIYSDSDSLYKNITFQNVLNSIDLSPAFNFGTASSFPVNIGNANNQTLNLQGSLINITGSNTIKNRSTVSTGVGFQVDGYNSADVIYYSTLSVDNSSVAGEKPNLKIMDGAGFTNTASKTLTTDANGKLLWATPSSGGIAQSEDTANTFILLGDEAVNNTTYPTGSNTSFICGMPNPITINGVFNSNFIWWDGNINTSSFNNIKTSIILGVIAFWGYGNSGSNDIEEVVAIGHGVAQYTHTAKESVFIGAGAGFLGGTSNLCVYIGDNAKTNSYNSSYSNVCCLGSGAESTSSNQAIVGNSSVNSFRIYGSWSNVSDRRDKYDIVDTVFGLDFINKLRVVDYKYNYRNRYKHFNEETKENYYETDNKQYACKRTHTGLISQEVKQVLDDEGKDHSLFQINNYSDSDTNTDDAQFIVYQETISMCVKAIQELSKKIEDQQVVINNQQVVINNLTSSTTFANFKKL